MAHTRLAPYKTNSICNGKRSLRRQSVIIYALLTSVDNGQQVTNSDSDKGNTPGILATLQERSLFLEENENKDFQRYFLSFLLFHNRYVSKS